MKIIKPRQKYIVFAVLMITLTTTKCIAGPIDSARLAASILISGPFTYWFVIPYLDGRPMELSSWGFALYEGKHHILRFVFFVLGLTVYILCFTL